ncbi:hypothetical protein EYF80_016127 [Liparis tanakae]|uniref:Uncharacterized protein n=1 Tax=Liparis tanakae TaxID=230148 RepID=A0A4Z2I868_9TELE|nr:hypothetical protein EYF80_016127 [Liparis tanakae]
MSTTEHPISITSFPVAKQNNESPASAVDDYGIYLQETDMEENEGMKVDDSDKAIRIHRRGR